MRIYLALLGFALAACSSGGSSNADPNDYAKPAVTPLGTAADKNAPATGVPRSVAPAPATAEAPRPAGAAISWPAPFEAHATCARVASKAATILARPVAGSNKFGQLAVGDRVQLVARTADGWVGFNPGSAQAGNAGIFRLRWVRASEAFAPGDSCGRLPLVQNPPLGCLLMAPVAVAVYQQPTAGATQLSTIPPGSYARVVKTSVGPRQWVEIAVPGSPTPGYVAPADANLSGNCQ